MRALIQGLLLVVLAVAGAGATHLWHPRAPSLWLTEEPLRDDEISISHVMSEWDGQVIWLDARPESEFGKGHIPGAYLLNEEGFLDQLMELLDVLQSSDQPVVIYCNGERCEASRRIREQLMNQFPLENVWVLKGGLPQWQAEGRSVERGSDPD